MHLFSTLPGELISIFRAIGESAQNVNAKAYLIGAYPRSMILQEDSSFIEIAIIGHIEATIKDLFKNYSILKKKKITKKQDFYIIPSPYKEGDLIRLRKARLNELGGAGNIKTEVFSRGFSIDSLSISINSEDFGNIKDPAGAMQDIKSGVLRVLNQNLFNLSPKYIVQALVYLEYYKLSIDPPTESLIKKNIEKTTFKKIKTEIIKNELEFIEDEKEKKSLFNKIINYK
jgi:tRNA nucleotidyltransferase/poly(A) polymerase